LVFGRAEVAAREFVLARRHDKHAQLYAFDLLDGEGDPPYAPAGYPQGRPGSILADQVDGIFIAEYERGDIGEM
jgi:hypothetical protein